MSKKFEQFIFISIIANTVALTLEYYNQPELMKDVLLIINLAFSGLFILEAIIKIVAFGKRYFQDKWNLFDFVIAIL